MGRRANGEGTFINLKNGKIRLRQQYGFKANGVARVLTVTGRSKSECVRLMREKLERTPEVVDSGFLSKGSLEALCRQHLAYNMAQRDYIKPTAADRRECTIRNQIEGYPIGKMKVTQIKSNDIEMYLENLISENRLSVSSIEKAFHVINGAYKWAIAQGIVYQNPCDAIKEKMRARFSKLSQKDAFDADVIVLSEIEKDILIKEALKKGESGDYINRVGPAVVFLLYTGLRIGEYCALRWGDIWFDKNWERVTVTVRRTRHYVKERTGEKSSFTVKEGSVKNAHARTIELSAEAIEVLREIFEDAKEASDNAYVYVNARGNPSNPSNMGTMINDLYRSAGLSENITGAHILRHTFATDLYYKGAAIKSIASYIGDLESTTERYYIAIRKTIRAGNRVLNVVPLPKAKHNK